MQGRHDHFISAASDRSLEQIDPKALIVLRLGTHQLKQMRVPSHAAINESVELANLLGILLLIYITYDT